MTVCPFCKRDMNTADSCSVETIKDDDRVYQRRRVDPARCRKTGRCADCGAREGRLHHFGCDQEACAICDGQFISCGCFDHVFEGEEDDDLG